MCVDAAVRHFREAAIVGGGRSLHLHRHVGVHDVGEPKKQEDLKEGDKPTYESSRSCILKKNMCLTNEPGIYFIELLMERAKANESLREYFNFATVIS